MNLNHPSQYRIRASAWARWLIVLFGCVMLSFGSPRGSSAETPKEYELKAAFIYNFTKFVEWPSTSFRNTNAPFVIAVAGNSPCTAELEKIAKERKINGRTLVIKTVTTIEAAYDAQALFIPAAAESRANDWLAAVRDRNVLTIGESELFWKHGGTINFLLEGEKIRFEINMGQADAAGLKVSAQLLKLAKTVLKK